MDGTSGKAQLACFIGASLSEPPPPLPPTFSVVYSKPACLHENMHGPYTTNRLPTDLKLRTRAANVVHLCGQLRRHIALSNGAVKKTEKTACFRVASGVLQRGE